MPKESVNFVDGMDIDEPDLEILSFFHQGSLESYRKEGLLYPMP
jgi:hypothetical protein